MAQKGLTPKKDLARHAEIMELYYSGDPISFYKLSKQFMIDRGAIRLICKKYYPIEGPVNVVMLIESKLNYQEDPEE